MGSCFLCFDSPGPPSCWTRVKGISSKQVVSPLWEWTRKILDLTLPLPFCIRSVGDIWPLVEILVNIMKRPLPSSWRKHVGFRETSGQRAFAQQLSVWVFPCTREHTCVGWQHLDAHQPGASEVGYGLSLRKCLTRGRPCIRRCGKVLGKFAKGCMAGSYLQDLSMCCVVLKYGGGPLNCLVMIGYLGDDFDFSPDTLL